MPPLLCCVAAAVSAFGVRNLFAFCHKKCRWRPHLMSVIFLKKIDTRSSRDLLRHTKEQIWYNIKDSSYIRVFTCRLSAMKRIYFWPVILSYGRKWIYNVAVFVWGAFAAKNICEMLSMSACLLTCNSWWTGRRIFTKFGVPLISI